MMYMIDMQDMSPPGIPLLHSVLNLVEELLSKSADVLVTVSEKVLGTFSLRPKYSVVIANYSSITI